MQGPQYILDGCPRLRITRDRAKNIDFTLNTPPGRTCAMTGSGTDTGAAARRGHDDLQRGHRRTHPVNATAHWATAACLADASAESAMAAPSAVLRASEKLGARSTGGVSDPQTAPGAPQPGRPTARPASMAAPRDASTGRKEPS
eukprot:scaffold1619_cov121-Isochrysis_galbana.AAC.13